MLTYSFDSKGKESLYEFLYKSIRNDILSGKLSKQEKLPSKRTLAEHLGISTITVENAYNQLMAEGYIYSRVKSGYYVSPIDSPKVSTAEDTRRYSAEEVSESYKKIKEHFISDSRLSQRKESLVGRLMLHKALEGLGVGEYTVNFSGNEKPVLQSEREIYFNISHSGDYVTLAISDDEVGCDIQEIRPYNPKVAVRHYCENETRLIESSDSKDDMFIRLWALKESILKFTGKGLSGGLSSYDFSPYACQESFTAFGCNFYVKKIENVYFALCHKNAESEIIKKQL